MGNIYACTALGWLMLALAGCGGEQEQQRLQRLNQRQTTEPVSQSYHVNYQYVDSGQLRALLQAPYAAEYFYTADAPQPGQVTEMERGFILQFLTPQGDTESTVKARQGRYLHTEAKAEARRNVVVTNQQGHRLETEELIWLRRNDELTTDKPVTITTEDELIYGDGLRSNTAFTQYQIFRIRGRIKLKEGGTTPAPVAE